MLNNSKFSIPTANFVFATGDIDSDRKRFNAFLKMLSSAYSNLTVNCVSASKQKASRGYSYGLDSDALEMMQILKLGVIDYCYSKNGSQWQEARSYIKDKVLDCCCDAELFFFNKFRCSIFGVGSLGKGTVDSSGNIFQQSIDSMKARVQRLFGTINYIGNCTGAENIYIVYSDNSVIDDIVFGDIEVKIRDLNFDVGIINESRAMDIIAQKQQNCALVCISETSYNYIKGFTAGAYQLSQDSRARFSAQIGSDGAFFFADKNELSLNYIGAYLLGFIGQVKIFEEMLKQCDNAKVLGDIDKQKFTDLANQWDCSKKFKVAEGQYHFPVSMASGNKINSWVSLSGAKVSGYNFGIIGLTKNLNNTKEAINALRSLDVEGKLLLGNTKCLNDNIYASYYFAEVDPEGRAISLGQLTDLEKEMKQLKLEIEKLGFQVVTVMPIYKHANLFLEN